MAINEPSGLVNRFTKIDKGYIITTGNTLISSSLASNLSSGPFITTDTSKQVSGYPAGTTWSWEECSSMAKLNILANSTILYAELMWYATQESDSINLRNLILNPIEFKTPNGLFNISAENTQKVGANTFCSINVTNIIKNAGSGEYTTGKIPGLNGNQVHSARFGWALTVVVKNDSQPYRVLRVDTGFVRAAHPNTSNTIIKNFSTPSSGPVTGRANFVVADGDTPVEDSVKAGPNLSSLVLLGNSVTTPNANPGTSPNNPKNNIFCGVINIADPLDPNVGKLDTRGTFGNRNHDGFIPAYNNPARNKWDITSLDISPALTNNQTQLILQGATPHRWSVYEIVQVSAQVDAQAPDMNLQYSVDKSKIYVGETITYSGTVKNNGGTSGNGVVFWDFFNNHEIFISGSVVINGTSKPSANPHLGLSLGTISPGQTVTFNYKIKIIKQPEHSPIAQINNWGYITYNFNPVANTTVSGRTNSNKARVDVLDLKVSKVVDREYAGIGYTLSYSTTIENLGHVDADNLKLTTNIPSGTNFISDTLIVDDTSKPGVNPADGTILSAVPPQSSIVVSWKIRVGEAIPEVNPVSCMTSIDTQTGVIKNTNTVSTQINHVDFTADGTISQTVDKPYADLHDIIAYTITLKNAGNVVANNVNMEDIIPSEFLFETGSITINGVTNNSTPDSLDINTIGVGQTKTIVFKAKVKSLPNENPLENVANISYTFTIDPAEPNAISKNISTNTVTTEVNHANISLINTSDKQYVDIEDPVIYNVNLKNTGNSPANNVVFTNLIPSGTSFVNGSVSIGGVSNSSANPSMGINVGTISAYSNTSVSFKIKVGSSIPSQNPIQSSSNTTFNYVVDPNNQPVNGNSNSNIASTEVNHADLISEGNFSKTTDKAYADVEEILTYIITIKNTGNVSANNVEIIDQILSATSFEDGTCATCC